MSDIPALERLLAWATATARGMDAALDTSRRRQKLAAIPQKERARVALRFIAEARRDGDPGKIELAVAAARIVGPGALRAVRAALLEEFGA